MTNEEARIIVGNIPINGDECYSIPEYQQAKAMAIKALEIVDMLTNRPCGVCKHHEHGLCSSWNCPFEEVTHEE